MRIVFVCDYFSEGMGYAENVLPPAMASLGHEVYVVASTMQVYGDAPFYEEVYGKFLGPRFVQAGSKTVGGVTLIRLPLAFRWRRIRPISGILKTVLSLKPDIVQTFDPRSFQTMSFSLASIFAGYKLFTSEHTVASVYPAYHSLSFWPPHKYLYFRVTETLFGWIASRRLSRCYAMTPDAEEIAVRFHGVSKNKVRHMPLGLDTITYHPVRSEADKSERNEIRASLGVTFEEMLCIYTGRFTNAKNPYCLAAAIGQLRKRGFPVRGLFFGEGAQADSIAATDGCAIKPFIPSSQLAAYFRASDVGVWPSQESISMLDAAACGLPIVVSDRMKAKERINGNGLTYVEGDYSSLASQLEKLLNPETRSRLGTCGAERMQNEFGVVNVAKYLLDDYSSVLGM